MNTWKILISAAVLALTLSSCDSEEPIDSGQSAPAKPAELPQAFLAYKAQLEASRQSYIKVTPALSSSLGIRQSKFMGTPFLPEGHGYLVNKNGDRLVLLAQFNFAEAPDLEGFPSSGILQFFIDPGVNDEHVWGMSNYQGKPWIHEEFFKTLQVQDNAGEQRQALHLTGRPFEVCNVRSDTNPLDYRTRFSRI